jgi:hypothetical protein
MIFAHIPLNLPPPFDWMLNKVAYEMYVVLWPVLGDSVLITGEVWLVVLVLAITLPMFRLR